MVIDRAGILDERQELSTTEAVSRLTAYGIPTQVVTEAVVLDQLQANARANELRLSHGIATAPFADDGLLVYLSVDRWDQRRVTMSISVGSRTLPRNGLDAEAVEVIRTGVMADQLAAGHPARAIVYSLREMIYQEQYVPPPAPPVTGWQADARPLVATLAPVLAVTGCLWLAFDDKRQPAQRTLSWPPLAICGLVALVLVGLSITTRSSIGVASAILLGGTTMWRWIQIDRQSLDGSVRSIVVTPRSPGALTVPRR